MLLLLLFMIIVGEGLAIGEWEKCIVPEAEIRQKIEIPLGEIQNVTARVRETVANMAQQDGIKTLSNIQMNLVDKIAMEAEDNVKTVKQYLKRPRQKRNIFTSLIGAATENELHKEVLEREMMKIDERDYRKKTEEILREYLEEMRKEDDELKKLGKGLNKTMNALLSSTASSRSTRDILAMYQIATHMKSESNAIKTAVIEKNDKGLIQILRNYEQFKGEDSLNWRVIDAELTDENIELHLADVKHTYNACMIDRKENKQCVTMGENIWMTEKSRQGITTIKQLETEVDECNFTIPITKSGSIMNEGKNISIRCLDNGYLESDHKIKSWEIYRIPESKIFCWEDQIGAKWRRVSKISNQKEIDLHYNIEQWGTREKSKEKTQIDYSHHALALEHMRAKLGELAETNEEYQRYEANNGWMAWITLGIMLGVTALATTVIYRVYKNLKKANEDNKNKIRKLEESEIALKKDLDGTLDYLKEIQKGTLRVEQAGSFFDDTFHGQQLIASTPKKHQKDEQPESLMQTQEEKK